MELTRRAMLAGLLGTGISGPQPAYAGVQITGGFAFGSSWRMTTDAPGDLSTINRGINAIIAGIDRQMSPFRPHSAVSQFNRSATDEWQTMPHALCHVASSALDMARLTGGAFDPTVGPLVSRFGFGPITGATGSYTDINARHSGLRKSAPGLTLDLCGIAKGYALDRIATLLRQNNVPNALVEVGGEVIALGDHPDGRAWNVAISDPTATAFRAYRIVTPGRFALATSGHIANGHHGDISISHIINPQQGRPASTTLASVSVLADTGLAADALATALCANGLKAGIALARQLNIAALFISYGPDGPTDVMTGRFAEHILI